MGFQSLVPIATGHDLLRHLDLQLPLLRDDLWGPSQLYLFPIFTEVGL